MFLLARGEGRGWRWKPRVLFVGTMRGLVTEAELSTISHKLRVAIKDSMDLVVTNGSGR